MGTQVRDEPHRDHLRIVIEGEFDVALVPEVSDQVLGMCEKHQASNILVDVRNLSGNPTFMERFTLASVFATKYIKARMTRKIQPCIFAVVGTHPLVDPQKFEETVAKNRGTPIKTFTDLREALMWLGVEGSEVL